MTDEHRKEQMISGCLNGVKLSKITLRLNGLQNTDSMVHILRSVKLNFVKVNRPVLENHHVYTHNGKVFDKAAKLPCSVTSHQP